MKFADFIVSGKSNILCTAIHNGHELSDITEKNMALDEAERFYEEDPHTSFFTEICDNRVIVNYSRFEVDLNRPLDRAYYQTPEHAWGLSVRKNFSSEERDHSLKEYIEFYENISKAVQELIAQHERIFIFDLHSYNHQRKGKGMPFDDPQKNPEIILGTNNMPEEWHYLVTEIREHLTEEDYFGRSIDARINVKFPGGHFTRWLHNRFPGNVVCLALEFKKIFMDEWTGEVDWNKARRLREILGSSFELISRAIKK